MNIPTLFLTMANIRATFAESGKRAHVHTELIKKAEDDVLDLRMT